MAKQTGILISNLGSPDEPTAEALKRYLAEFLWDPWVVRIPRPVWWLILNGIILRKRPAKSAEAYQRVWTDEGSPLINISRRQHAALDQFLDGKWPMELAMRYGNPSIPDALQRLRDKGVDRIVDFALYPQYSEATNRSTHEYVRSCLQDMGWQPEVVVVDPWYEHSGYIQALADSITRNRAEAGDFDHLVISWHGIPVAQVNKGDPYQSHCNRSSKALASALGLEDHQWTQAYQSRFGAAEWLQPYMEDVIRGLAEQGIERVAVICPGFTADCLETLDEIDVEYREVFEEAGGQSFRYIRALNDHPDHIQLMAELLKPCLGD